jgi:plastocyanin
MLGAVLWNFSCKKTQTDYNGQGGTLPTKYVIVKDSSFYPSVLTVAQGNTVTFVNETDSPHALSIDSTHKLTDTIAPHTSFIYTNNAFTGQLNYYCRIHPNVTGSIIFLP